LLILGIPFAGPLAIFIGFVSQFVPAVGTYIAYAVPVIVALTSTGVSAAVTLVVFAVLYQQVENLFISPKLSARTMQLHPAVAFVAALVGGAVGGVAAAFLALPVAAIFQAFGSTFLRRYEVVDSAMTQDEMARATPERTEDSWVRRLKAALSRADSDS
jgi:predicted PurR-regulated permease PerM